MKKIETETDKMELVLDKVFQEKYGKNKLVFENYKTIYDLPHVKIECKVSKSLFDYCLRKKYFVLLLLYDEEGKIYVNRQMSNALFWGLPGCSIKDRETINQTLERLAKTVNSSIKIGNVEPVISITNSFIYSEQEINHYGLGFMARIRNKNNIKTESLTGDFIDINTEEISFVNSSASKKIIEVFCRRYKELNQRTNRCCQENEINTNEVYKKRYEIHNNIVKKFILTNKRKRKDEFKALLIKLLDNPKSIVDISCGEDKFIFNLSRELGIKQVVGNDISWSQIEFLSDSFPEVIFTNHNAASLPFKKNIFDVAFCSNTLHHMPNKETLISVLKNMYKISKRMVIIEIENPTITGGLPRILNKYWYIKFLKDVGGAYLSFSQFKTIMNSLFSEKAEVKFDCFRNITGNYMVAEIIKNKDFENDQEN